MTQRAHRRGAVRRRRRQRLRAAGGWQRLRLPVGLADLPRPDGRRGHQALDRARRRGGVRARSPCSRSATCWRSPRTRRQPAALLGPLRWTGRADGARGGVRPPGRPGDVRVHRRAGDGRAGVHRPRRGDDPCRRPRSRSWPSAVPALVPSWDTGTELVDARHHPARGPGDVRLLHDHQRQPRPERGPRRGGPPGRRERAQPHRPRPARPARPLADDDHGEGGPGPPAGDARPGAGRRGDRRGRGAGSRRRSPTCGRPSRATAR